MREDVLLYLSPKGLVMLLLLCRVSLRTRVREAGKRPAQDEVGARALRPAGVIEDVTAEEKSRATWEAQRISQDVGISESPKKSWRTEYRVGWSAWRGSGVASASIRLQLPGLQ